MTCAEQLARELDPGPYGQRMYFILDQGVEVK